MGSVGDFFAMQWNTTGEGHNLRLSGTSLATVFFFLCLYTGPVFRERRDLIWLSIWIC